MGFRCTTQYSLDQAMEQFVHKMHKRAEAQPGIRLGGGGNIITRSSKIFFVYSRLQKNHPTFCLRFFFPRIFSNTV